ncbi:MAG TPA: acyl-CoA synthetase, partial [Nocardioides sp.]|nr:acyl-CoA synthetase [Nocardioides sp.]
VVLREDVPDDEASIATLTEEVQALVKERKGAVQAPKRVIVAESLPLTGLGKPDKKALRAQYWEGDRSVG